MCACVCMCDSSTMQNTVRPRETKSILSTHFIYKDKFHFVFPFLMSKRHSHHRWKTGPPHRNRAQHPSLAAELKCRWGESAELAGRGAQSHPRREEPGAPAQPRLERAGRPGTGGAGPGAALLPGLPRGSRRIPAPSSPRAAPAP